ncbi:hypothetical protein [Paenibacillus sp. y28]|uniref:hypothetical protein n=1 Tax=Paenibacillus sp. y28 TaxID=3129110 RepID=UPI0030189F0A
MTKPYKNKEQADRLRAEEAWTRLQGKLASEPVHPQWAKLAQRQAEAREAARRERTAGAIAAEQLPLAVDTPTAEKHAASIPSGEARRGSAWAGLRRQSKWLAGAAAACLIVVTVATPAGNNALAAVLNKFQMKQLTVVNEDEMRQLFQSVFQDGSREEAVNQYGTFSAASGTFQGSMKKEDIQKQLGRKLVLPKEAADEKQSDLYVSPWQSITLQMNVNEVNATMKKLGATALLPESVDGKPVKVEMKEAVHFNFHSTDEEKQYTHYYSLTQMPVPTVTVDPSIPVKEAMEAIVNFPLLPASIKQSLQASSALTDGNIPLPVFSKSNSEQVSVSGTEVVLTSYSLHASGRSEEFSATWVKEGQLFTLNSGSMLGTKEAMLAKITELMNQ